MKVDVRILLADRIKGKCVTYGDSAVFTLLTIIF